MIRCASSGIAVSTTSTARGQANNQDAFLSGGIVSDGRLVGRLFLAHDALHSLTNTACRPTATRADGEAREIPRVCGRTGNKSRLLADP